MRQSIALLLVIALSVAFPAINHAQSSGGMKGMDMKGRDSGKKTEGAVHKDVGVVRKVDPARNAVTLDHGPIKSLNWPAMSMSFSVKDRTLLDKLQTGKTLEFEFVQQGKDYVVTRMK